MTSINKAKSYFNNLVSSFGNTILSIIIGFISVPISLNYWGTEKYGLWALINSVTIYLSLSNLGLNSAATILMTKNPSVTAKLKIMQKAFNILIVCVFIFLISFILLHLYYENWITILGRVPAGLKNEALSSAFILGVFLFLNLPFSLISSGFQAFQRIHIENIFTIVSTIINFFILLLVIALKGNLLTYAFLYGITTIIFNFSKTYYFYYHIYRPSLQSIESIFSEDETSYKDVIITAGRCFLIFASALIVIYSDFMLISHLIGVKDVAPYSVTQRIFQISNSLILLTTSSMLPIVAKEFGNNNMQWINDVYGRMLLIMAFIGGLIWISGILFVKDFILIWTGERGYAGITTVFFLGGYSYLLSMVNLNSGMITSFNYLKGGPFYAWSEAVLKISFSIISIKYIGVAGVALGTFLGSLLTGTWIGPYLIVKRSQNKINYNFYLIIKHLLIVLLPALILSMVIQIYFTVFFIKIILAVLLLVTYSWCCYKMLSNDFKILIYSKLKFLLKPKRTIL